MTSALRRTLARVGDLVLDPTILLSFDRTGFRRHSTTFRESDLDVDLSGRVFAVTGANSGIGKETTRELAARGARVWMLCRNLQRADSARAELVADRRVASAGGELRPLVCDVSDLESVTEAVRALAGEALDGVIHNAGALGSSREFSAQGIEQTLATHLVGPLRLTALVLPLLRRTPEGGPARIIWVSSGGMYPRRLSVDRLAAWTGPFDGVSTYADVKRAQVVLSEMLAARLAPHGVTSRAMHPGWASTAGVQTSLPRFHAATQRILRSPGEGADTVVWLAACRRLDSVPGGGFWFDRRKVSPYLLPGTKESAAERQRLWVQAHDWAGLDENVWGSPEVGSG
jgi:NAD(P)-dependent dehydrogenase (short-subunit alcohol dehydrogenase family)